MLTMRGRAFIESHYGPLGSGGQSVTVKGTDYDLEALLFHMGLNFEDSRGIDAQALPDGHYVVRYYDGEDQRIVAHEFDSGFHFICETRAHIAEWIGEDGYFEWFRHVRVRCPANF